MTNFDRGTDVKKKKNIVKNNLPAFCLTRGAEFFVTPKLVDDLHIYHKGTEEVQKSHTSLHLVALCRSYFATVFLKTN